MRLLGRHRTTAIWSIGRWRWLRTPQRGTPRREAPTGGGPGYSATTSTARRSRRPSFDDGQGDAAPPTQLPPGATRPPTTGRLAAQCGQHPSRATPHRASEAGLHRWSIGTSWMPSTMTTFTASPPPASSRLTMRPTGRSHLFRLQAAPVIDIDSLPERRLSQLRLKEAFSTGYVNH